MFSVCCNVVTAAGVPWQSAAAKSTAADDPHFKFFTLAKASAAHREQQQLQQAKEAAALKAAALTAAGSKLSMSGDIGIISGPDVSNRKPELSDCLRLNANLPWPLGVLITPRHLDEYNNLFALLLKVKRVQLDLEAAWQELGRCAGMPQGNCMSWAVLNRTDATNRPCMCMQQHSSLVVHTGRHAKLWLLWFLLLLLCQVVWSQGCRHPAA